MLAVVRASILYQKDVSLSFIYICIGKKRRPVLNTSQALCPHLGTSLGYLHELGQS